MTSAISWAFVTPSYSGDLDRCRLLCRSMDAFVIGPWHHYLIVDQPDLELFKEFTSQRRTVLLTHDIVPKGMHHLIDMPFTGGRSLWWSRSTGFMIGWHLQQFVKIGMASQVQDQGLAYCDSDVFFLKPFDVSQLSHGHQLRMYRSHQAVLLEQHANPMFTQNALGILGLPVTEGPYFDFVDNFVTWHRPTVLDMCSHIEARTGRSWHGALGRKLRISEYALYGNFVSGVQIDNENIYCDPQTLCRTMWAREGRSDEDIKSFCASLSPPLVSVGIQSFAGVDVAILNSVLDASLIEAARGLHSHEATA